MNAVLPLIALLVLAATVVWVHAAARRQADAGQPVVVAIGSLAIGSLAIDSPAAWTIGCVVAWVIVFPLYLVARRT